ncbi:MAG: type II toxin-antitoxin system PemK/MazF family toxin [Epsilonproteobacteria bacterium]|nr:type II toxin-antitoxin system PemK/MazF family toxin [Campylobacterota bacterium]
MIEFDKWNKVKKATHKIERKLTIKPREIYWLRIGQNIGHEEFGKGKDFLRPVIVVRQLTKELFIGIPTTTSTKENNTYFHNIQYTNKKYETINSVAMILQFRVFSKKRLLNKIAMLDKKYFSEIIEKLKEIIDPAYKG